jgi:hypothetical protein
MEAGRRIEEKEEQVNMLAMVGAVLLMQVITASSPARSADPPQDSAAVARLRERMAGQREVRVRIERGWVRLTRPMLGDAALAYREAWFDRLERDTVLPNPLPLRLVSVAQVKGKGLSLPAVALGGLTVGVSVLASTLLSKAIAPTGAPDNATIFRASLLGFGVGATVGAAESVLIPRWVTVYRR